ncbi:MAG: biosynthetic-type acetolactate synthase large subunit [Tepidanaerobacter acetatoxydans]|jgi:acetolactate synthase-1/2/3 large subunit|uniref:biosynthetic-type acetolactate synthase large subunit n=1 Tax=Tepidanaerobacter TaxID=499228 RepID=UPI000AF04C5D|nr:MULTISPECIES: biosynthetic-type acetolactate synthase large subunit [Tepidanaerobacter]NLU11271.1 biosynthetic-type acetolactate synthase large subunit [Tepidanaerobacter acetatoxydans]
MKITGAQALIKSLEIEKVKYVFGYPGGAILPVYDALNYSKIKHILTRSEQAAAHAASGYARVSGNVGVCMATSGPGATNLVTGIATAYMDSIPIIAITGQVSTSVIGKDVFQEVDITGATAPFTKHNYLIKDANDIPRIVKEAFYIASTGRPGPVLIDLPKDVAETKINFKYPENISLRGYKPNIIGHSLQISRAAELINKSRCPVICAGGGINSAGAEEELMQLAEKTCIPVVTTLMGIGAFPANHPLHMGMIGMHGIPAANKTVTEADLVIAAGSRFADRTVGKVEGFAPKAKIIHIDIDPAEIGKNIQAHIPIVGDVKQILGEIVKKVEHKVPSAWNEYASSLKKLKEEENLGSHSDERLNPIEIIRQLSNKTKGKAIITTEVGCHQMWTAQYYEFIKPRTFISSGGLGTMGYGLPAAIGAQMAKKDEMIINICGDGSFQMNLTEMATAVENNLPVKIVLFNNSGLGLVRQLQEFYCDKRYNQVYFSFVPDFIKLAESYNFKAMRIQKQSEISDAIDSLISHEGPFLLECILDINENVYPMVLNGSPINEMIGG